MATSVMSNNNNSYSTKQHNSINNCSSNISNSSGNSNSNNAFLTNYGFTVLNPNQNTISTTAMNNHPTLQIPYLEQGIESPLLHHSLLNNSGNNYNSGSNGSNIYYGINNRNNYGMPTTTIQKGISDTIGISHNNNNNIGGSVGHHLPSYYDMSSSNDVILHNNQQHHIGATNQHALHSNPANANNNHHALQNNFFSPEHVDGMVSILKGEEDFISLLDQHTSEQPTTLPTLTSTSFDHHSFNPTIVASTTTASKKRKSKKIKKDCDFEQDPTAADDQVSEVKSSPCTNSPSSSNDNHANGGGCGEGSDNATATSPTNSQEKNSPYPNGRKRASKACVECQKRHTRCGFERPCVRCVRLGLNCVEMKSTKKRGRSTMSSSTTNLDNVTTTSSSSPSNNTGEGTTTTTPSKKEKSTNKTSTTTNTPQQQSKSSESAKKRKSSPITQLPPGEKATTTTTKISHPVKINATTGSDQTTMIQSNPAILTTLTSSTTATNVIQTNNNNNMRGHISYNQLSTTTNPSMENIEKPLGVIAVGPDFVSVQYVSDPLSGMFSTQPLTRLESIMSIDFIQTQLNLLCEAKATRETIISHVDNGLLVLQQSHLRAERTARAMIKLKDGKHAEMGIKFVFMYNPASPSILDSAYVFLNWNGSYLIC